MSGCGTWVPVASRARSARRSRGRDRVDLHLGPAVAGMAAGHEVEARRNWPVATTTVVHGPWNTGRPSTRTFAPNLRTNRRERVGGRAQHDHVDRGRPSSRRSRSSGELDAAAAAVAAGRDRARPRRRGRTSRRAGTARGRPDGPTTAAARSASPPATSRSGGADVGLGPTPRPV